MHSYEDRIRAIELYQAGQARWVTIRQLSYPTKNFLKSWHEQYEGDLDGI